MKRVLATVLLLGFTVSVSAQRARVVRSAALSTPTPNMFLFATKDPVTPQSVLTITVKARDQFSRPWSDVDWRRSVALDEQSVAPVTLWRWRGDSVCAARTFLVSLYPGSFQTIDAGASAVFAPNDIAAIEASDAYQISLYINGVFVNSVQTNERFDWRAPRSSPPWGSAAPYVRTCEEATTK